MGFEVSVHSEVHVQLATCARWGLRGHSARPSCTGGATGEEDTSTAPPYWQRAPDGATTQGRVIHSVAFGVRDQCAIKETVSVG